MDTQKIIDKFETRKNNTKRALSDLKAIMYWISGAVDNLTVPNPTKIHYRASGINDYGNTWTRDYDTHDLSLCIINGECGLYYISEFGNLHDPVIKNDIDYINLGDAKTALYKLLIKLSEISDRIHIADVFAKFGRRLAE